MVFDRYITLADMDAWEAFARENRDDIVDTYGSVQKAFSAAICGGLVMGGGAAPTTLIYFDEG